MKNKKIIEQFEKLIKYYKSSTIPEDKFRVSAYTKSLSIIKRYPIEIKRGSDVKGLGKSAIEKVDLILNDQLDIPNENELVNVIGIGPKLAQTLNKEGIYTVQQLRKSERLNAMSRMVQVGVKYYEGLQKPIPRKKVELVKKRIEKVLGQKVILAGSYQYSKKQKLNDIDIIIIGTPPIDQSIKKLFDAGLLIDTIGQGSGRFIGVTVGQHHIDIHMVPREYLDYYMLYFAIGVIESKELRRLAKQKGYKLNEYGLWKGKKRLNISAKDAIKLITTP